jgi:uncharacterized membrane protein YfhO
VERPTYTGDTIRATRGTCSASIATRRPTSLIATVRATTDCELELPIAYFPGWRVKLNDVEMLHEPPSSTGRIRLTVNAPGTHHLEATFTRTPVRWVADVTSALAALIAVIVLRRRRPPLR